MSLTREEIVRELERILNDPECPLLMGDRVVLDMALRALPEREGWVSVAERLPNDNEEVRFIPLSGTTAMNGWYETPQPGFENGKFWRGDGVVKKKATVSASYTQSVVTHWMLLPAPPAALQSEDKHG